MPARENGANPSGTIRVVALLSVIALAVTLLALARPSGSPTQAQSVKQSAQQTVIGRDCQQCHRLIVQTFPLDAHGKSAKFLKDSRGATCEACHGNSDKHAETSTKTKSAAGTINPARLNSGDANQSCLQCHSMDRSHFNWKGGKHDRSDMSCLSCHSVHHTKLIQRTSVNLTDKTDTEVAEILNTRIPERLLIAPSIEETCLGCHVDQRKALFQRSTHFFRTENWTDRRQVLPGQPAGMKVTCTSCHDPHCHTPHGSNNVNLLTTRTHQLCQECHMHMLWRHQTVAGFDIFTFNKGCVNCHALVHGSNHPSGKALTR